jgi:hypothetical protein
LFRLWRAARLPTRPLLAPAPAIAATATPFAFAAPAWPGRLWVVQ